MSATFALQPWQRTVLRENGIDPGRTERLLSLESLSVGAKPHGDPTLGGDGLRIAVDADCPHCGWPERFYDTRTRKFGCIKCRYTSDERNA